MRPTKDSSFKVGIKHPEFELICGDAKKVVASLPSESVQAVVTSPPYWGLRSYGMRNEIGGERRIDTYFKHLSEVFTELLRVVKRDGVLWAVIGDTYTSGNRSYRDLDERHPAREMQTRPRTPRGLKEKDLIGLPWRFALLLQELGWHLRTEIIWHKPNAMPESVRDRPQRNHEYLFLFSKGPRYIFDRSVLDRSNDGSIQTNRSVWSVNVGADKSGHIAGFPIQLISPCIASSSIVGDLILDPFSGSASVGVACIQQHRKYLGIDLNPVFVDDSRRRLILALEKSISIRKSPIQSRLTLSEELMQSL